MNIYLTILGFLACAIVIFFAGRRLSYYGDIIAGLTGLGGAWIGLILLATVTSLPELISGISAVAIVQEPDLAVSSILGSCAFNLLVFALMDYFVSSYKPIFSLASQNHVLAAIMSIILLAITGVSLYLPEEIVILPWLGLASFSFIILYFIFMRIIYQFEMKQVVDIKAENSPSESNITLKKAGLFFTLYSFIIIMVAFFLPYFAEQIAENTGLGKSFVGTLFLAASTVLPEIAVSISAIRQGFVDLAVGNLMGSNLFNIFILFIDDLFYTKGHLLKDASDANIMSVFSLIIMVALVITGLTYRPANKKFRLSIIAALILAVYILNIVILYKLTS